MLLLAEVYESFARTNRRIRSRHTTKLYQLAIRQFSEAIGHLPTIHDLTDDCLAVMETHLSGRSPYTVNERVGRIKAIWRHAARKGLVHTWPPTDSVPEPEPYKRAWDVPQLRQLLAACDKMPGHYGGVPAAAWWLTWHVVQFDTGERTGAMLRLRWDWLGPRGLEVPGSARKGGKSHFYRLSGRARAALERIETPSRDLIFPWPGHLSTFYIHYGRLLKHAGLPSDRKSKPQRVRRSHLTYWLIGHGDPASRAKHGSSDTTWRHYIDESLLEQPDPADILPEL